MFDAEHFSSQRQALPALLEWAVALGVDASWAARKQGRASELMPAKPLRWMRRPVRPSSSSSAENTPSKFAVPCTYGVWGLRTGGRLPCTVKN